jgi:hypothetical protein
MFCIFFFLQVFCLKNTPTLPIQRHVCIILKSSFELLIKFEVFQSYFSVYLFGAIMNFSLSYLLFSFFLKFIFYFQFIILAAIIRYQNNLSYVPRQ